MAFVLDRVDDMRIIYETAKRVYSREITVDAAVKELSQKTDAKASSLQMYINIYACMRKGKVYKMGTSESFTQFLLESILRDEGPDAFKQALIAVKSNAVYRASKDNAQPGLLRACKNAIAISGISIDFESLPTDYAPEQNEIFLNSQSTISEADREKLKKCIALENKDFTAAIMGFLSKYQVLSDADISVATSRDECRERFNSSYPMLLEIDPQYPLTAQIQDAAGRKRFYDTIYKLNGRSFVMTSQLYGLGSSPSMRDNRTPFLKWTLDRVGVTNDASWWPSSDEYDPRISTEKWLELLNAPDILGENIRRMLAGMYIQGGSATCAQLAELYGKTASHYVMTAVHAAENVVKATNCPILQDKEDSKYWPVFFVGRNEPKTDRFIWKIRDELYAALTEYGIEKHLPRGVVTGKFDSWEIIDENTAVKHCDKSFFEYRGSGVPKGICWFFNAEDMELGETKVVKLIYNGVQYQGSVKNESSDRRRVRIFWNTELGSQFDVYNASNVTAMFKRISADTYEVSIEGGEKEMTIKEKVAAIKAYIAARGFNYEGDLIENFYLSLKSKPFVILAGTSGTGKTRLVKLFAEAIGAKMKLVPVRPDWSDSSDLFGHTDLSNQFHPGAIIDFIKQAEWDKSTPHFLCLDEMNLARVEYYLSDFLSIIETRDRKDNGAIETDALVDASYFRTQSAREKYGRVYIPENLYIIGTVNMDETTFPFSKKVLDRANTIEFSFVNLMAKTIAGRQAVAQKLDNSFLKTDYLYLRDCDDEDLIDTVCFNLEELNQILVKANLHVGYRVRDEISFYMMNNKKADLLNEDAAFDHEIMQKILPRVQGSSAAIKDVLSELFAKCAGDYTGFAGAAAYEQMNAYLDSKSCKYPNSAKKIAFMMRRYEEDGFTSYWL